MVMVHPGFHMVLPPEGRTPQDAKVPEGVSVTDIPELASVMVASYGRSSNSWSDSQDPVIVLDFVHLGTASRRRILLDTGLARAEYTTMYFAARSIGGGRVLVTYHQLSPYGGRGPGHTPRYLQVIDASEAVPRVGTRVEIGPGRLDDRTVTGVVGIHRVGAGLFTAVFAVWRDTTKTIVTHGTVTGWDGTEYPSTTTTYETSPTAHLDLWTRPFRISGVSISVGGEPVMSQRLTLVSGEHWIDHFDKVLWVDEPGTLTLAVPPRYRTSTMSDRWYQDTLVSGFFVLSWTGGAIASVRHENMRPVDDRGEDPFYHWPTAPKIARGYYVGYAWRDHAQDAQGNWSAPTHTAQIYTGRIGQQPSVVSQVPYAEEAGLAYTSRQNFGMWGYYQDNDQWQEPSDLMPDVVTIARSSDWQTTHAQFRLGVHTTPLLPIENFRRMPLHSPPVHPYDEWHFDADLGGDRQYSQMIATRSGYVVSSSTLPGYLTTEELVYQPIISVWRYAEIQELQHGLHRTNGIFS